MPGESSEKAEPPRFALTGRANPVQLPACLEAGIGPPFAAPSFIIIIIIISYFRIN